MIQTISNGGLSVTSGSLPYGFHGVVVVGDIDAKTAPCVEKGLLREFNIGHYVLVVDLLGVTYMDSTALDTLVWAYDEVRQHQGQLVIVCNNPRHRRLFSMTGLDARLDIIDSDELPSRVAGVPLLTASRQEKAC